ncbi:hypothetical protein JIN82_13290 [Persicirhabdus sediminis]|uniref:Uncharacterized protein n=1 Tax=Persicirhabdus sediminis TaxID=454144 RepID=A0A8J7SMK6_9BACT|nr:hypothetical protein [Persicirhabdus sediminis]
MNSDQKRSRGNEPFGDRSRKARLRGFKQAGSITNELTSQVRYSRRAGLSHFPHNGLAALLLIVAVVLRVVIMLAFSSPSSVDLGGVYLVLSMLSALAWIWGCVHLAIHFGLNGVWGLLGIFFIFGLAVILWAARQKPRWDLEQHMQAHLARYGGGDPNSLY